MFSFLVVLSGLLGIAAETNDCYSNGFCDRISETVIRCSNLNISQPIFKENCFNENITSLDLSNNNISSLSSPDGIVLYLNFAYDSNNFTTVNLTMIQNLRQLNLSYNVLSVFPHVLTNSKLELQNLDLSFNKIHQIRKTVKMDSIEQLDLQNNQLKSLSDGVFHDCPKLEKLILSGNNLQYVKKKTFGNLTSLKVLNLSKNQLQDIDINSFLYFSKLETLDLSYNLLQKITRASLNGLQLSLINLDLSHNKLTKISPRTFSELEQLRFFFLQDNKGIKSIKGMKFPYHLKTLDFGNCSIQELNDCDFVFLKDMQRLNLDGNPLSCNCHLYSIVHSFGTTIYINQDKTCKLFTEQKEEDKRVPIGSLESKCHAHMCNKWDIVVNSLDLNVSSTIDKGKIVIKWMTSIPGNGFHIFIKDSSQKQIVSTELKYEHEYEFESENTFVTYHVCVDVIDENKESKLKKCIKVYLSDTNMITGILAGLVAMIPCLIVLIYIVCKDRQYHRAATENYDFREPTQEKTQPTALQKTQCATPNKSSPFQDNHNKGFQHEDNENPQLQRSKDTSQAILEVKDGRKLPELSTNL